ncbi:MAG: thiamine phosphate synthase [Ruminococcus sp.]|nr:thiamine phosphate synthase [Ruminococcus sp.]
MFKIICVTDRKLCEEDFLKRIGKIAQSGIESIILREKDLSDSEYKSLAEEVVEICHKYGKKCILHSHHDIVGKLGADGLHVTMEIFRSMKNNGIFTGVSCHSVAEAQEAEKLGAGYIIAGHIFQTDCKKGLRPRGLDFLNQVCHSVKIPVYAIGGINMNNMESVINAGASGGCIMSGFMRGNISEYR